MANSQKMQKLCMFSGQVIKPFAMPILNNKKLSEQMYTQIQAWQLQ